MRPPRLTIRTMMVAMVLVAVNLAPLAMGLRQSFTYRLEHDSEGRQFRYYDDGSVSIERPGGSIMMVTTPTTGVFVTRDGPLVIFGSIALANVALMA